CPDCLFRWEEPNVPTPDMISGADRTCRRLPPELEALDVVDTGEWGGCGCPLLVPRCRRDGAPGCRDYRRCKNCGRPAHPGVDKPGCAGVDGPGRAGYCAGGRCCCELGPCDHVRALKDHGLTLEEWGAELQAALPYAGERGQDGFHESREP